MLELQGTIGNQAVLRLLAGARGVQRGNGSGDDKGGKKKAWWNAARRTGSVP